MRFVCTQFLEKPKVDNLGPKEDLKIKMPLLLHASSMKSQVDTMEALTLDIELGIANKICHHWTRTWVLGASEEYCLKCGAGDTSMDFLEFGFIPWKDNVK